MPLLQPALTFNFNVVLWDVQGPNVDATASSIAGSVAGQLIFGSFSEVQGLEASIEMETYQEGGLNDHVHKFIKTVKFPNLVLKRGITARSDLWDWHLQVQNEGQTATRKSGVIVLLDRGAVGATPIRPPVAAWMFERGLPEKLQGPSLDGKSNNVAIETLEISHEQLTRISLSSIPGIGDVVSQLPTLT